MKTVPSKGSSLEQVEMESASMPTDWPR